MNEDTVRELRERAIALRQSIEQDDLLLNKYFVIADVLRDISEVLAQYPIDCRKLSVDALGITRILDGPLYNPLEESLVDFAGKIGLLVQRLEQNS